MPGTRQMRPSAYCSKTRAGAASGELQPNMRNIAQSCKTARSREAIADNPCCCREITEIILSWVGRCGAMPRRQTGSPGDEPVWRSGPPWGSDLQSWAGADKFSIPTTSAPDEGLIKDPAIDLGHRHYTFFMRTGFAPSRIFMHDRLTFSRCDGLFVPWRLRPAGSGLQSRFGIGLGRQPELT